MMPSEKINGRTTIEAVTGETPDMSEYVEFDFCEFGVVPYRRASQHEKGTLITWTMDGIHT